jgi:ribonuclease Z
VRGCKHILRTPTRDEKGEACPIHGIRCHFSYSGATYSYADVRGNIIASPNLLATRIIGHPFKYESHRLGLAEGVTGDNRMSQQITITAYSTALYSTWIFVDQWRLLLDAGDGVCAGLLQKTRKIHTVAVTHSDRDHLAGLHQILQLNARDGLPRILYPADCSSFPSLAAFCERFDPHTEGKPRWTALRPGDVVNLVQDYKLKTATSFYFTGAAGKTKSVSYFVVRETRKLKPEYVGFPQAELDRLRQQLGVEQLTQVTEEPVLAYSGDTIVGSPDTWRGYKILIHEATHLSHAEAGDQRGRRNQHSVLPDVLRMAQQAGPKVLILTHFSPRYRVAEVLDAVQQQCRSLGVGFPVHVVPPGEIVRDVLNTEPVWGI